MEQWKYLQNQFLTATKANFKMALKLSNYHDAALKTALDNDPAHPDYLLLYNRYHPVHLEYVAVYTEWKNAGGQQEGQTLNVSQLLTLLKTKVNKWDNKIQETFETTTPSYKAIFPNAHYPFNSGGITSRIVAVQTLSLALAPHAALAAVKLEVDAFYILLDLARDTQEGAKGSTKSMSDTVDDARVIAMNMQYQNVGYFINMSPTNTGMIAPFYELLILRRHLQVLFAGTLESNETEAVLTHTFTDDDQMRVSLDGIGTATLYLSSTPGGINSTGVVITGSAGDQIITMSQFAPASYGTHRYLTFVNNGTGILPFEIELM
jgi:hypothetical protein